jgi:nucleotide-binding universal stress UspA family protein
VGRRQHAPPDTALEFAAAEARLRGERLTVAHVWDLDVEITVDTTVAGDDTCASAHALPGPVEAALLAHRPDLLVLSRNAAARRLSRLLHGCLRHATCPVAVVPSRPLGRIERVVVGVCGTPASEAALRWGAREADLHGADLQVVHAWQFHPSGAHDLMNPTAARARVQSHADQELATWVDRIVPGVDVSTSAPLGGPLDRLLEAAADADLVVIGSAPHHGLHRVVHGHLADDLSLLLRCPIVVVPVPPAVEPEGGVAHRRSEERDC